MADTLTKGRADISTTGEKDLDGNALISDFNTYVVIEQNQKESSYLVTITSYAKKTPDDQGSTPIFGRVPVFSRPKDMKEIQRAISTHLQSLVDSIVSANQKKPQFFVIL